MRLGWTTSKYSTTYRTVKTVRVNSKNKTLIVKTFGSEKYICETYGVTDAKAWAKEQVRLMNEAEQEDAAVFQIELSAGKDLPMDKQRCFNGGYLFIQQIYYELGLDQICSMIPTRHGFDYNLNAILSRLLYTQILFPSSKCSSSSYKDSFRFIEQPDFELHQIYRALSVLAEESDYIQSRLFKNSLKVAGRRTEVIYYPYLFPSTYTAYAIAEFIHIHSPPTTQFTTPFDTPQTKSQNPKKPCKIRIYRL